MSLGILLLGLSRWVVSVSPEVSTAIGDWSEVDRRWDVWTRIIGGVYWWSVREDAGERGVKYNNGKITKQSGYLDHLLIFQKHSNG